MSQHEPAAVAIEPVDHGPAAVDESWSAGVRLMPASFDYLSAPKRTDGLFLGDYVGLAAAGDDFFAFFPVTTEDDPANAVFVPIRGR